MFDGHINLYTVYWKLEYFHYSVLLNKCWNVLQPFKQVAPKSPHTHSCRSDVREHAPVHVSAHSGLGCNRKALTLKGDLLPERKEIPTGIHRFPQERGGTGKREPERWGSALDLDVSPLKSHFGPQERKIMNGSLIS